MSKYIDAEKLIAEIHKHIGKYDSMLHEWSIPEVKGKREEAFSILTIVESLQQEQPEVDLDAEIAIYLNKNVLNRINNSDIIEDFTTMEAGELARHFYELGLNARKKE